MTIDRRRLLLSGAAGLGLAQPAAAALARPAPRRADFSAQLPGGVLEFLRIQAHYIEASEPAHLLRHVVIARLEQHQLTRASRVVPPAASIADS